MLGTHLFFFGFRDVSRFRHLFVGKNLVEADRFGPPQSPELFKDIPQMFKYIFDLVGFGYILRVRDSNFLFLRFPKCATFHNSKFFLLEKTWEKPIVLNPRKIQIYSTKSQ